MRMPPDSDPVCFTESFPSRSSELGISYMGITPHHQSTHLQVHFPTLHSYYLLYSVNLFRRECAVACVFVKLLTFSSDQRRLLEVLDHCRGTKA